MPLTVTKQLPSSWGRAAVSRFTKTPEQIQAEIVKALEEKLSVEFKDYSQWQRIPIPEPTLPLPPKPTIKVKPQKDSRPLTGVSGTSCSSLCIHPWNKKPQVVENTEELEVQKRVAILKQQIKAKQISAQQYRDLCDKLKSQNDLMKSEIDSVSSHTHGSVRTLLEKYAKYSTASKTLGKVHIDVERQTQNDLAITSKQLNDELTNLEKNVLCLETQLRDLLQDLQILRTYKDKEYPVKAMQIAKLKRNVHNLAMDQKNEKDELLRITMGEYDKMRNEREFRMNDIMATAADKAFCTMIPPGLQHMASHNMILEHEIEQHKKEIRDVEAEIEELEFEIQNLKQNPKSYQRLFVFPEAFLPEKRCEPNEDIILDIPTRKVLPL